MLSLHVIPVGSGDCLLLEHSQAGRSGMLLVDGGADHAYPRKLRDLSGLDRPGSSRLDLLIASGAPPESIGGLPGLLADLWERRAAGREGVSGIGSLWHNTFRQTIGVRTDIGRRIESLLKNAGGTGPVMAQTRAALAGIGLGQTVQRTAIQLGIAVNPGFTRGRVVADESPPDLNLGGLTVRVVSPTRASLGRLRRQWRDWLSRREAGFDFADPLRLVNTDRSLPPLGHIIVLVEAGGCRLLLTGGGGADQVLQGLEHTGLLPPGGVFPVDVLQLPSPAGTRSLTRRLLEQVPADRYIVPSGDRDGQSDPDSLGLLVAALRDQGRRAEIWASRRTAALERFTAAFPPDVYGYRLGVPAPGHAGGTLALAS